MFDKSAQNEIEILRKEVEYWRKMYHEMKDMNERLSLDLGIKNNDFIITQEKSNEESK